MGEIPPSRRRLFDISSITRRLVPHLDHLVVVHRVPLRLLDQVDHLESPIDVDRLHEALRRSLTDIDKPDTATAEGQAP